MSHEPNRSRSRIRSWTIASLLILLAAAATFAQPRSRELGHRAGHGDPVAQLERVLDLTPDQVARVEAIFEAHRATAEATREAQRANREALRGELEMSSPDATTVGELFLEGRDLAERARSEREAVNEQVSAILTDEQRAIWEGFRKGRRAERRGPGGCSGHGARGPGDGPDA